MTTIVFLVLNVTKTREEVERAAPRWWYTDGKDITDALECNIAVANRTGGPSTEECVNGYGISEPLFPLKLVENTGALRPGEAIEWVVELTLIPWYKRHTIFRELVRLTTWSILDLSVEQRIVPAQDAEAGRRVLVRLMPARRQVLGFAVGLKGFLEILGALCCITVIGRGFLQNWQRVREPFGFHVPPGPNSNSHCATLHQEHQEHTNRILDQTKKNNITFICEEQNLLVEELLAREAAKRALLEGDAGLAGPVIMDLVVQPELDEVFGEVAEPLALEDGLDEEAGDGPLDVAVLVEQEREREEKDRAVMEWWHESQAALALEDVRR